MKKQNQNKNKTAYSLLELSIVIAISAILVTGGLAIATGYSNNDNIRLTSERMDKIYEAMGRYLLVNNALPCPASIAEIKTTSANYGASVGTAGTCSGTGVYTSSELVYGAVPVKALGLESDDAQDGFKSKIAYIVDRRFTKPTVVPDAGNDSFGTATPTSIITVNAVSSALTETYTSDAIFVLVSSGSNQASAFGVNRSVRSTRSTDASEMENDVDDSNVFNATIIAQDTASDIFDDIVFYKTRNDIVLDFAAYAAIPCPETTISDPIISYGSTNHYWPQSVYDAIVPSTQSCESGYDVRALKPTRKCEALGNWGTSVITPCSSS